MSDDLDWSWDELTDGVRTTDTDDDLIGIALFAGVDDIESHKKALTELNKGEL